jgi:hypothetical protein
VRRLRACVRHGRLPWETVGTYDFDNDKWELYRIDGDFSEANDMAAREAQRLRELQDLFWVEAAKNQMLPLDDRLIERADPSLRPSLIAGRSDFTYYPGAIRIPESSPPYVKNRSHSITAHIDVPKTGGDGVVVAAGGVAGYAPSSIWTTCFVTAVRPRRIPDGDDTPPPHRRAA